MISAKTINSNLKTKNINSKNGEAHQRYKRIFTNHFFFENYREYFPQNIMHDRRIMRGSTYAAMVIPAGTNPDAMVMDKSYPKKRTFKKPGVSTKKTKNIYPNREISTPEPVHGRSHMEIQTSPYKEILTDKPPEREQGIATEFYLDRPPVPLF